MAALLMRCADGEAAVPSDVVRCDACGQDCWLSKHSGAQTLALARLTGDSRKLCSHCFDALLQLQEVFGPRR
jgi:hypothetical protein